MIPCPKIFPLSCAVVLGLLGIVLHFWIAPYLLRLEAGFTYQAELSSIDNFYSESEGRFLGENYSISDFSYRVTDTTGEAYQVLNRLKVLTQEGNLIFETERVYAIDPYTLAHMPELGDREREGYLFAPRFLEEGEKFYYWHVNYDTQALMSFVAEESFLGLKVHHYESYYENSFVDQSEELGHLPNVGEGKGIVVEPHLELWVEPISGYLVKYEDHATAYYYDSATQEKLSPWNQFSNSFTEDSVAELVGMAKILKLKILLFTYFLPLFFFGIGLFLFFYYTWHHREMKKGAGAVSLFVPVSIIGIPIAVLVVIYSLIQGAMTSQVELLFEERMSHIEEAIQKRIEIYANTLEGAQGLFAAYNVVERSEWKAYVDQLELAERYPGVLGVGVIFWVPEDDKELHIQTVRDEGFPEYTIFPDGDREAYAPIVYLEPFEGNNMAVIGFDLLSDNDARANALLQARDSGETALSKKFELIQAKEPGFALYVPLYAQTGSPKTIEERRDQLIGFAYSPFQVDEFILGLFGNSSLGVNMQLFDGTQVREDALMYEKFESEQPIETLEFERVKTFYLLGRPWTLRVGGLDEFQLEPKQKLTLYAVLIIGSVLTLFFIFLFFALFISRQRLIEYVRRKKRFISL